jgi:hypothetical protein
VRSARILFMERSPIGQEQMQTLEALKLKEQWNAQVKILSKLGILETFPDSKQLGIRGIDDKEYPVPKPEEITELLEANREMVLLKMEQGFTKLVIEPFAYSFDALSEKYKRALLRHHKNGKLLATKDKPTDPDEPLPLDENQPLYRWEDGYKNCDGENKVVYFPKEFSKNHGGTTKKELLAADPSNAWRMWLVEDMPNIPREGKGKEVGKRKQLESNKTPAEYLKIFQTESEYKNESGLTPEADLMYALTHLEETDQVINDYQGKGSLSYQVGAYFPASAVVPDSCWDRGDRQASLSGYSPANRYSYYGARAGVRVGK